MLKIQSAPNLSFSETLEVLGSEIPSQRWPIDREIRPVSTREWFPFGQVTRRWQLKCLFIFHPYLGKWSNLTSIFFQMGWFNHHQLDSHLASSLFLHLVCKTLTRREFKLPFVHCFARGQVSKDGKRTRCAELNIFFSARRVKECIFWVVSLPRMLFTTRMTLYFFCSRGTTTQCIFFTHVVHVVVTLQVCSHKRLIGNVFAHLIHLITKHFRYLKWGNPHL